MARIVQVELPNDVTDLDIEYVMEMLRIMGRWVTKDLPATQAMGVRVTQGRMYTSL